MHEKKITEITFICEKWEKHRYYDLTKQFSNEVVFLTLTSLEDIKIWSYSFNPSKPY